MIGGEQPFILHTKGRRVLSDALGGVKLNDQRHL